MGKKKPGGVLYKGWPARIDHISSLTVEQNRQASKHPWSNFLWASWLVLFVLTISAIAIVWSTESQVEDDHNVIMTTVDAEVTLNTDFQSTKKEVERLNARIKVLRSEDERLEAKVDKLQKQVSKLAIWMEPIILSHDHTK